jgi:hypothetical protein
MSHYEDPRSVPVSYWYGRVNLSAIALALGVSRPTLYAAKQAGRLVIEGERATFTPAPIGAPVGRPRK